MYGEPLFEIGANVKFETLFGVVIYGKVDAVNVYGTFFCAEEPSYDIFTDNGIYRGIPESLIVEIDA